MANLTIDLSLNEEVFKSGVTFSDISIPFAIDTVNREYKMNVDFIAVGGDPSTKTGGIQNIFQWLPGQRILLPEFGNLIYKFVSDQINNTTSKNIAEAVRQMFQWDSRVQLNKVEVTPYPDDNEYQVYIEYYIPMLTKLETTTITVTKIGE